MQQEVIAFLQNYYATTIGDPMPLKALTHKYGTNLWFPNFGYDNFGDWMQANYHRFIFVREINRSNTALFLSIITEDIILSDMRRYYLYTGHLRNAERFIRRKYNFKSFESLGFGTFSEFCRRYNIRTQ